jgi:hypothetical protein
MSRPQSGFDLRQVGMRQAVPPLIGAFIFAARIEDIPKGGGQGQIVIAGTLMRSGSMRGADSYPAALSIPKGYDKADFRLS